MTLTATYQPCTIVSRKVFFTNLNKNPESILGPKKEGERIRGITN